MSEPKNEASQPNADLRDVVIYELSTRKVSAVVGKDMSDRGFYTCEKRVVTALMRCNDSFSATDVPAAKYKVGDAIDPADL